MGHSPRVHLDLQMARYEYVSLWGLRLLRNHMSKYLYIVKAIAASTTRFEQENYKVRYDGSDLATGRLISRGAFA